MKRKKDQQETISCPHCGGGVTYMAKSLSSPASFINYAPAQRLPKDQRTTEAVDIPFKHALHIAAPIGFSGCILCVLSGVSQVHSLGWGTIIFSVVFVTVRVVASIGDWNQFLWQLEQLVKIDVNKTHNVGNPPDNHSVTTSITVEERASNGKLRRIKYLDWPCEPDDITEIAHRLLAGKLAEADWGRGKVLSVPKFKSVRKSLIGHRYGSWKGKDKSQGWELTPAGRVFLGEKPKLTNHPTPPPHS